MIKLSNVSFSYDKKNNVLENVNYTFKDSGLYGILARSGFGKTTFLNLVGGIYPPSSGSITYSSNIKTIEDNFSYIFQDNNLLENLTLYENIEVFFRLINKEIDIDKVDSTLDYLGIKRYKDIKVKDISGGERQRVSIAIAILKDSKVIIADEPFSSLDKDNSIKIMEIFKELSKDRLIIFTTHNSDLAYEYSDHILDLEHGLDDVSFDVNLVERAKNKKVLGFSSLFFISKKLFNHNVLQLIFSILIIIYHQNHGN